MTFRAGKYSVSGESTESFVVILPGTLGNLASRGKRYSSPSWMPTMQNNQTVVDIYEGALNI